MSHLDELREGLQLFERHAWAGAYAALARADERAPLACAQWEVLATAAYLAGSDGASDRAWARAVQLHAGSGRLELLDTVGVRNSRSSRASTL